MLDDSLLLCGSGNCSKHAEVRQPQNDTAISFGRIAIDRSAEELGELERKCRLNTCSPIFGWGSIVRMLEHLLHHRNWPSDAVAIVIRKPNDEGRTLCLDADGEAPFLLRSYARGQVLHRSRSAFPIRSQRRQLAFD